MAVPATCVLHLADIHIGSSKDRHEEYIAVFGELRHRIQQIIRDVGQMPIAVIIAGDIFHHMTHYSGADIDLFNYLLECLCGLPTAIIPGNHDANLNNTGSQDLITPLVPMLPNNVVYWRESGVYTLEGLQFYHLSVFDSAGPKEVMTRLLVMDVSDKILLYHGLVDGVNMNKNYTISGQRITRDIMRQFRAVMLGDFHEHGDIALTRAQVEGDPQSSRVCAVYAGSLIQQNLGETTKKGFVVWKIPTDTRMPPAYRFTRLHNDVAFLRIDVRGQDPEAAAQAISAATAGPAKVLRKVSIMTDAYDYSDQERMVVEKFGRCDAVVRGHTPQILARADGQTMTQDDLRQSLDQLMADRQIAPALRGQILELHDQQATHISVECQRWTIIRMEWSDYYRYGPNNAINFANFHAEIAGVVARNEAGKSSIIDILVLALFNDCLRGDRRDAIRMGAKEAQVTVDFSVNDVMYRVERADTSRRHTTLQLTRGAIGTPEAECLTEQALDKTYAKVRELVGSLAQFMVTGLYYDPYRDITRMSKTERMRVLPEMFGLRNNEQIIKDLKVQQKAVKVRLDALQRPRPGDLDAMLGASRASLEEVDTRLRTATQEFAATSAIIKQISAEMPSKNEVELRAEVTKCVSHSAKLRDEIQKISELITQNVETNPGFVTMKAAEIEPTRATAKITCRKISEIEAEIASARIDPMRVANLAAEVARMEADQPAQNRATSMSLAEISAEQSNIMEQIRNLLSTRDNFEELSAQILAHEDVSRRGYVFDAHCESCRSNSKKFGVEVDIEPTHQEFEAVKLARQKRDAQVAVLEARAVELRSEIVYATWAETAKLLDEKRSDLAAMRVSAAKFSELTVELMRAREVEAARLRVARHEIMEQYNLNKRKKDLEIEVATVETRIAALNADLTFFANHPGVDQELAVARTRSKELSAESSALLKRSGALGAEISRLEEDIEVARKYAEEAPALEADIKKYKTYAELLGSDDLKLGVIRQNFARVLANANSFLKNITKFQLAEEIDASAVEFYIESDVKTSFAVGSGFQKFIIALALRLALTSLIPAAPNFIIIDEGFGCMDAANLEKTTEILPLIKHMYQFIFLVSHVPRLQAIIERPLTIHDVHDPQVGSQCSWLGEGQVPEVVEPPAPDAKKAKQKVMCECGKEVLRSSLAAHVKSRKHLAKMGE